MLTHAETIPISLKPAAYRASQSLSCTKRKQKNELAVPSYNRPSTTKDTRFLKTVHQLAQYVPRG